MTGPTEPSHGAGYEDDPSISDDEIVYRRIATHWAAKHGTSMTSASFQDTSAENARRLGCPAPGMSVHMQSLMAESGLEPSDLLEDAGEGLVAMRVGDLRQKDMGITPWELPGEPAHAIIFTTVGSKRTKGQERAAKRAAMWVIEPPPI